MNQKILRFSLWLGIIAAALVPLVYLLAVIPSLQQAQDLNTRTLSEVTCSGLACDTDELTTDWRESSDYLVDIRTRYFLNLSSFVAGDSESFAPLDFCDTEFIRGFRHPNFYDTPDRERWRLYSRGANWNGRAVEIMVGYAVTAPWKMLETPAALVPMIDAKLESEADRIADNLPITDNSAPKTFVQKLSADGLEIADAATGQVLVVGPPIPMKLPSKKPLPKAGRQLYLHGAKLYIVQSDVSDRLLATSLVMVGNVWWLTITLAVAFVGTTTAARGLSRRFLRDYFATRGIQVPDLEAAVRLGEGQSIEFKRGISDDENAMSRAEEELLKSIAAFANTNDGAIFIGIDDWGKVQGLKLDFKQRDRLEQKIRQLIRNRIKPVPPVQVTFLDVRGLIVAKIVVPRGGEPVHLLNGTIYVREGSSDIQAQPEHLNRLFGV